MATNKPLSFVEMSAFALSVAQNWQTNYPAYSTGFLTANDLKQMALAFKAKSLENSQQIDDKKANTKALKAVNKAIDKGVKRLKDYIQERFPEKTDLSAEYESYFLERRGDSNWYFLPKDNDNRAQILLKLLAKLQLPDEPFRNNEFGFSRWEALQTQHQQLWENSKNMRAAKSILSKDSVAFLHNARQALSKLSKQIRIDFPAEEVDKVLRGFGFLNEDFNRAAASHARKQKKEAKKKQEQSKANQAPQS